MGAQTLPSFKNAISSHNLSGQRCRETLCRRRQSDSYVIRCAHHIRRLPIFPMRGGCPPGRDAEALTTMESLVRHTGRRSVKARPSSLRHRARRGRESVSRRHVTHLLSRRLRSSAAATPLFALCSSRPCSSPAARCRLRSQAASTSFRVLPDSHSPRTYSLCHQPPHHI